jgi:serine/threonine protein kinase
LQGALELPVDQRPAFLDDACAIDDSLRSEVEALLKYHNGKPLDPGTALAIALQIADALAAAHEQNIVHRDIKPGNIVLSKQGQVKVLDFGLAKSFEAADTDATKTRTGAVLGTPAYMSPEQVAGKAVDFRSDLFSFGIVLYEMLAGTSPFRGKSKTPVEIMHAVMHDEPCALLELNPQLPEALVNIIQRLLAKHPEARFASMREAAAELRKFKGGSLSDSSVIRKAVVGAPLSKGFFRRKQRLLFACLLALALTGFITVSILRLTRNGDSQTPAANRPQIKSLAVEKIS